MKKMCAVMGLQHKGIQQMQKVKLKRASKILDLNITSYKGGLMTALIFWYAVFAYSTFLPGRVYPAVNFSMAVCERKAVRGNN
jgi:hypothetical protein